MYVTLSICLNVELNAIAKGVLFSCRSFKWILPHKNKKASKGAQLVPMKLLTVYWKIWLPKTTKMLSTSFWCQLQSCWVFLKFIMKYDRINGDFRLSISSFEFLINHIDHTSGIDFGVDCGTVHLKRIAACKKRIVTCKKHIVACKKQARRVKLV
jgi:hypothetical protein